jgi:hypothetical protein
VVAAKSRWLQVDGEGCDFIFVTLDRIIVSRVFRSLSAGWLVVVGLGSVRTADGLQLRVLLF